MPVKYRGVPFTEAIEFLRKKVDVPTNHWDDLLGTPHAKAFTIAGANKMALVDDFHAAINNVNTNGQTITDFRKHFDEIVQKHGWSYKGKRGWRTRVIYNTNTRAAHMAGKWEQFQRTKESRPYLQYLTVGDARVRAQHRDWHSKVLLMDDPFWDTHYPPNGWGCRCTVRTLSERQLKKKNLKVSQSPKISLQERVNSQTGESYGQVPEGIDTGFDYNVGKAWLAPDTLFGEKIMQLPEKLRTPVLNKAAKTFTKPSDKAFKYFIQEQIDLLSIPDTTYKGNNYIKTAGFISGNVINSLKKYSIPTSSVITIKDQRVGHLLRHNKKNLTRKDTGVSKALLDEQAKNIPKIIRNPDAVLWDTQDPALLYIKKVDDEHYIKLIVRLDEPTKVRHNQERHKIKGNYITTAGIVQKRDVTLKRYEILEGGL